jgi:Mg2+ and Co2+ transporter CorA
VLEQGNNIIDNVANTIEELDRNTADTTDQILKMANMGAPEGEDQGGEGENGENDPQLPQQQEQVSTSSSPVRLKTDVTGLGIDTLKPETMAASVGSSVSSPASSGTFSGDGSSDQDVQTWKDRATKFRDSSRKAKKDYESLQQLHQDKTFSLQQQVEDLKRKLDIQEGGSEDSSPSKVEFEEALIHNKQLAEELQQIKTQMNEDQSTLMTQVSQWQNAYQEECDKVKVLDDKNTVLEKELRQSPKKGDTEPLVHQVRELEAALEEQNDGMSTLQTQANRICDMYI